MMKDDSWIYRLNEREAAEIESAFARSAATAKHHDEVGQNDFPLDTFGRLVTAMRDQIEDGRGLTLLKGVPVGGKTVEQLELLYAGIAAHIGTSIAQDTQGTLTGRVEDHGTPQRHQRPRNQYERAFTPHCDSEISWRCSARQAKSGGANTWPARWPSTTDPRAAEDSRAALQLYHNIAATAASVPRHSRRRAGVSSTAELSRRLIRRRFSRRNSCRLPPLTSSEDAVNEVAALSMRRAEPKCGLISAIRCC
jgi:hypothetical protein